MFLLHYFVLFCLCVCPILTHYDDLIVFTVATDINDGSQRFLRSAKQFGYEVKVLGSGSVWSGGDVAKYPGGGQKIRLLKEALSVYSKDPNTLILFTDSYDVVFTEERATFLQKYHNFEAKVIFSAEKFCWPDASLADKYPVVDDVSSRFLNSGSFIGPASYIYDILNHGTVADSDDDQLYYTKVFLNKELREKYDISLDTHSELFQNLNGALDDVYLDYREDSGYLVNNLTGSKPCIAHGNGPIKVKFNSIANYLAKTWTPSKGCIHCFEDNIKLSEISEHSYPIVQISAFINSPTPFLEDFFASIINLNYPKDRLYITLYCNVERHYDSLVKFNSTQGSKYRSAVLIDSSKYPTEIEAKKHAWSICIGYEDCAFVLTLESFARLTNVNTLKHLVIMNRNIVAPLLVRPGKLWSNFWGDLNFDGYYARSFDYMDIVNGRLQGMWNVPFVSSAYLFSRWTVRQLVNKDYSSEYFPDMAISEKARSKNIFMMIDNQHYFGHLVNLDNATTTHLHNDLWQVFDNPMEWEHKYINPDYFKYHNATLKDYQQPCPDVFWFPLMSERFAKEFIEEMEHFGEWSGGTNIDTRLEGGYENVPTIDIHMRQIGWEDHWIHVLKTYVHPIVKVIFEGYSDLPTARMNFVVRYKPNEQPTLRPHHDSSTYTLNMALNKPGIEYQGGGARFIRYNCSVIESRVGWTLVHPGRLTHYHEGLRTTSGTRYIFITFVNP